MVPGESHAVIGEFFRLTFVENRAAVMGIGLFSMPVLTGVSIIAVIGLGWWLLRLIADPEPAGNRIMARILPWVIGGALGNLIDRLFLGAVTDMLDVDIPDIAIPAFQLGPIDFGGFFLDRWWVFNIADSFIFVGMLLIIGLSMAGKLDDVPLPTNPGGAAGDES